MRKTEWKGWINCILIVASLSLTACAQVKETIDDNLKNEAVDYKVSRDLPPLEAPPGLTLPSENNMLEVPSTGSMTYSEYATGQTGTRQQAGPVVLPEFPDVRVVRDGDSRWLVIRAEADQVWSKVREFWLESGFILKREDPAIGIMETEWAENRADIPTGVIRSLLGKFADTVYSASTRDKFRVRLERGREGDTTELYLSHHGAEEVTQGSAFVWQARPSDPELEAEMLNRMIVSFGITQERAKAMLAEGKDTAPDRAYLMKKGEGTVPILLVREGFSRAWRRTGLALDRIGFTVEDRDRSRGLFYVRYVDPLRDDDEGKKKGWFSKLKFWGKDKKPEDNEYLIRLHEQTVVTDAVTTRVEVLDKSGQPEQSSTAGRILALLHEQLK
uniref:Outer membrane protein assembly factor BamC n=1 Tax=Candidatus Kentrum sp. FM TaxID=2126340 RepID=A0A450TSF6_9GAMM|nr:MAG: outer membrane protein assembly factor BamC [Candidatus Kentron sp. FM]VFJ75482.1 MAG: outer membrane protein assembly factor BamC [Candidatus Kentron sp. FM]VFK18819.1 MAG: outer membrane protein assembly factor BamC [Candidatus Kentron sp. FM]